MNNDKLAARNVLYNTAGTFFYFFCQWLITVLVVRISGYHDAGILSLIISITNLFFCVSLFGVRNYQVSDVLEEYSDNDYLYTRIITTFASLLLFMISLCFFNLDQKTLFCALIYIIYKFGESFSDAFFGSFQKYSCYKQIAISYTFKGVLTLSTFAFTLQITKNLFLTLLVNVLVYYAVVFIYDLTVLKKNYKVKIKRFNYWKLIKTCFPLMLYSCMVPYLNFITRFIVEKEYGTLILGYYSSITMVFVVLSTLMNSIFVSIIPKISLYYIHKDRSSIEKSIKSIMILIVILALLTIITASFLGEFVFTIIFGKAIINYMYLLIPTIIASIILTITSFFSSILIAFNMNKEVLYCNFVAIIICTLSLMVFVEDFALTGTLYSLIFSLFITSILLISLVYKKIIKF